MTWGELKALVEAVDGLTDDTEIAWVDISARSQAAEARIDDNNELIVV